MPQGIYYKLKTYKGEYHVIINKYEDINNKLNIINSNIKQHIKLNLYNFKTTLTLSIK